MNYRTREEWLEAAVRLLAFTLPEVKGVREELPPIKVSVGIPKGNRKAVGQCWGGEASGDKTTHQIFIHPALEEVSAVLPALLHELIHAYVGVSHKHQGLFVRVAKAIGFTKPWTGHAASAGLAEVLAGVAKELGPYPHTPLTMPPRPPQTTRMRLWECDHGIKLRSARVLNVTCLDCNTPFKRVELA